MYLLAVNICHIQKNHNLLIVVGGLLQMSCFLHNKNVEYLQCVNNSFIICQIILFTKNSHLNVRNRNKSMHIGRNFTRRVLHSYQNKLACYMTHLQTIKNIRKSCFL